MTWVALGASQFESDWMAWHRFLWMNAITGDDLWRALSGETRRSALPDGRSFHRRYMALMASTPLMRNFAQHFRARSLSSCFGPNTGGEMLAVRTVRFCPECLRACFHSPVFQLACIKRCPLHRCELVAACPRCGGAVGQPMFDPAWVRHPLACECCRAPFADDHLVERALSGFAAGELVFGQLEAWMTRLRTFQFVSARSIGQEPVAPRDYKTICAGIAHHARGPTHSKSWLDREFPCKPLLRRRESELSALERFANDQHLRPINPDLDVACAIAKSMNHQLSRRLRAICGHRHTMRLNWEGAARQFSHLQPVLLMSPRDCPCCAILDQWRAYAGKVLALRNRAREPGKPLYERHVGDFRVAYSLEPAEFANALLSSFTWFAAALGRVVQYYAGVNTQLWYPNEEEFFAHRLIDCNVMPLEADRFHIAVSGYFFSENGERICFAYSIDHAFRSLKKCHQLFLKRKYWMALSSDKSRRNRDRNDWYMHMSDYLQTRFASTQLIEVPNPCPQAFFAVGGRRADR
ncbi:hypothetical protein GNX71_16440 [Variovorax sp. RKNM96]|uniref:hypothetical protein n=1 Tax=Variovorax sp. RKNM96 TaxID=2681552 RepID=UPI0019803316|nr:hypothetical protein [Variovorax sp. RKNM96]QSI31074.1 hypothetical protein GNX71_16440 [Variovorax sp. RKNM96]